jgi:hypothetical protein
VKTPNEFWLTLHELAQTTECEGATDAERIANILELFRRMPPVAREQVRDELLDLLSFLPDLYSGVAAETPESPPRRTRGAAPARKHA